MIREEELKEATPSMPVEILGLNDVPNAGEIIMATDNEKKQEILLIHLSLKVRRSFLMIQSIRYRLTHYSSRFRLVI